MIFWKELGRGSQLIRSWSTEFAVLWADQPLEMFSNISCASNMRPPMRQFIQGFQCTFALRFYTLLTTECQAH